MRIRSFVATASLLLAGVAFVPSAASAATVPAPSGLTQTGKTTSSVTLEHRGAPKAERYRMQVSRGAEMQESTYYRSSGASKRQTVPGLRPDTTYFVRVRVITGSGKNVSDYSKAVKVRTGSAYKTRPLRVGTYNVCALWCTKNGALNGWHKGRAEQAARAIDASDMDVVGLQESGVVNDHLARLMRALGKDWAIASKYQFRSGRSTAVIYRTSRVSPIGVAGGASINARGSKSQDQSATWGAFVQRATKKRVLVMNVHQTPFTGAQQDRDRTQETRNAASIAAKAKAKAKTQQTVWVGDFNSYSLTKVSNRMGSYGHLKSIGFEDAAALTRNRAAWDLNSLNGRTKQTSADYLKGRHMDHVYVERGAKVLRWEQQIDSNRSSKKAFTSDHNMIWADLALR